MTCGAHRVLAVQQKGAGSCLLGLSDDVDCAVVELTVSHGSASADISAAAEQPPTSAAPVVLHPAATAGEQPQQQQTTEQREGQPRIRATHIASIPALAYVAAGKTQRKALLLAPPGDAPLLCLLGSALRWHDALPGQCSCCGRRPWQADASPQR